ncbi:MAG: uroporphyrinogen decarboxylase family protein [Roseibacillus sp.]|nr:uroporphyrinogen decarboxylase family protein [Roseibacillus sp.]MDP7496199.1 uroporphyrinogen decarboxylase family protein [Roseibacillus sp.]MDP7656127.1 uroporphyrinogen decarboxylase family protein [Roseibacillus sp.]HJM62168.1 uroporphyrinogen decarboxylase family protein [Roseibacillus sp.]
MNDIAPTRRDQVRKALAHESGRVPMDFGSTAVTGIHVSSVELLRDHYGLEKRPVRVCEPYQMLGEVEEDLADAMGIDTVSVVPHKTLFGFPNENYKEFQTPWGQVVLVSEHFNTRVEPNGDVFIFPEGDMTAPASGQMPSNGFFFDTIVRQPVIDEDKLDPEDNLEEFGLISDEDLDHYRNELDRLEGTDRAIVATLGGMAFGDIALVPAPFLKHPKGIRDIAEWYISTAARQDYIHEVFSRQCDYAVQNLEKLNKVLGDRIDVVFLCGTDFGTQVSTFCSPQTFSDLWAPYYRQVNDWIHRNTSWKTFKHSCGAVESFMEHFIEVGFDIINPVQCSASGMDPRVLKEKYGDRLVFWGGGVDTQKTMPFGTPEEVRREVLERCEIFAPNGGFVFDSIHNLQALSPVENMVAMIDAVREFNGVN